MDAVVIGSILTVVVSIIIVAYLFVKGYKLINDDSGKK